MAMNLGEIDCPPNAMDLVLLWLQIFRGNLKNLLYGSFVGKSNYPPQAGIPPFVCSLLDHQYQASRVVLSHSSPYADTEVCMNCALTRSANKWPPAGPFGLGIRSMLSIKGNWPGHLSLG